MWRKYIGATTERSLTPLRPVLPRCCSRLDKYIFACHSTAASANWQLKCWTPAQAEAQAHARSWNVPHIFWHFQYLARHIINTLTDSDASLITKIYENNWTEIKFCWRRQEMQLIIRYVRWYDMIRYDLWLWLTFFLARLTPVVSALTWVQHPGADPEKERTVWDSLPGSGELRSARCVLWGGKSDGISTRLIFTYPHFALLWLTHVKMFALFYSAKGNC